jgi:hypothetical protein
MRSPSYEIREKDHTTRRQTNLLQDGIGRDQRDAAGDAAKPGRILDRFRGRTFEAVHQERWFAAFIMLILCCDVPVHSRSGNSKCEKHVHEPGEASLSASPIDSDHPTTPLPWQRTHCSRTPWDVEV